jgi:hypothetical protein
MAHSRCGSFSVRFRILVGAGAADAHAATPRLALLCIFLRATMSQMDVLSRKSYSTAVVDADHRTATAGITHTARTIANAFRRC